MLEERAGHLENGSEQTFTFEDKTRFQDLEKLQRQVLKKPA